MRLKENWSDKDVTIDLMCSCEKEDCISCIRIKEFQDHLEREIKERNTLYDERITKIINDGLARTSKQYPELK